MKSAIEIKRFISEEFLPFTSECVPENWRENPVSSKIRSDNFGSEIREDELNSVGPLPLFQEEKGAHLKETIVRFRTNTRHFIITISDIKLTVGVGAQL